MTEKDISTAQFDERTLPDPDSCGLYDTVDDMTMRQQKKDRFSQDTRFRKHLANWVMIIVPAWLCMVILVLLLHGCELLVYKTEVVVTLLATTTLNVLGLAYIVLKGIFPEGNNRN